MTPGQPARTRTPAPPKPVEPPEPDTPPAPRRRLTSNRIIPDPGQPGRRHRVVDSDGQDVPEPDAARLARFKTPDGDDWLEFDEWPTVVAVAVCGTSGCPVRGAEVRITLAENVDGVYRAGCGRCGQAIADLYEVD